MRRDSEAQLTKTAAEALLRNILSEAAATRNVISGVQIGAVGGADNAPRWVWERRGCSLHGVINYAGGVVRMAHELPDSAA